MASYSVKKLKPPKCVRYIAWDYPKAVWFDDVGTGSTESLQPPKAFSISEVGPEFSPYLSTQGIRARGPHAHPLSG